MDPANQNQNSDDNDSGWTASNEPHCSTSSRRRTSSDKKRLHSKDQGCHTGLVSGLGVLPGGAGIVLHDVPDLSKYSPSVQMSCWVPSKVRCPYT